MISWIQITFQKHFKVIFAFLLAITIVSFIFTIGASPGLGRADRRIYTREFFGVNIGSQEGQRKLFGDASLSVELQAGYSALESAQLQQYAFSRQAALALANQLGMPPATTTEIADYIKTLRGFADQNGAFDPGKYNQFREMLRKNPRLTEADVSRVLSDNVRVEQVQRLLGGPGYVLPSDVKSQMDRTDSSWTIGIAKVDSASFNPVIKPTDAQITKFYADNNFRYEIPAQVSVRYVEFPAAAYLDSVKVTDEEVRAYYDANPARFPKPAPKPDDKKPGIPPQGNSPADYAAVKPVVEMALRLEKAGRIAAKAGSDLSLALYDQKIALGSPELDSLLANHKVVAKDAKPFAQGANPPELGTNPQISEEAFKLNKERYFSDAISSDSGSIVLFWKENIPAHQPLLAEVREKVAADYIENDKRKQFVDLGKSIRTQLATRIKAGSSFESAAEAVASSAGVKIEAKIHPAFTLRQRPQDLDFSILTTLDGLKQGEVSEMSIAQDSAGLIVYAKEKKTPALSETNPLYAATSAQISTTLASTNSGEYLSALVQQELAKSAPARP